MYQSDDVSSRFVCRLLGRVAVKGKTQGVEVHEVLGFSSEVDPDDAAAAELYSSAVRAFFSRDFSLALAFLARCVADRLPASAAWADSILLRNENKVNYNLTIGRITLPLT